MHKSLIGFLAALALCVGCSSTSDSNKMTCETAKSAYEAYQVLVASGAVDIDPKTVAYVKIAAAFLDMYCGWSQQMAPAASVVGGVKVGPMTQYPSGKAVEPTSDVIGVCDANGVPVVTP